MLKSFSAALKIIHIPGISLSILSRTDLIFSFSDVILVEAKIKTARVLAPPTLLAFSDDLSDKIRERVRSKVSATLLSV